MHGKEGSAMKKIMFAVLLLWILPSYSQLLIKNIVTKIEVRNITAEGVVLQWYSDAPSGVFNVYKNPTNVIGTLDILRDSSFVVSTNMMGVSVGRYFRYMFTVPLTYSGRFYFAVLPAQGSFTDEAISKGLVPLTTALSPELNYTIQPITFKLRKTIPASRTRLPVTLPTEALVTSLRLVSEEDVFRLTWTVYPRDFSQYVFSVYRSKYPISNFNNPVGLPVYAQITNKFFFEDRNISFETPYYYAVVAQNSLQWESGINVFTDPAVLVKNSPPFLINTQKEFIRRKEEFNIQSGEILSEDDIEAAVRQTLSNLRVMPILREPSPSPSNQNPLNLQPLTPSEMTNPPVFSQQHLQFRASLATPQAVKEDTVLLEKYYRVLAEKYNQTLQSEEDIEKEVMRKNILETTTLKEAVAKLNQDITAYKALENRLIAGDRLSTSDFNMLMTQYIQQRDQIRLTSFYLKNEAQILNKKMDTQVKAVLTSLNNGRKEFTVFQERLKVQHQAAMKKLYLARIKELEADRRRQEEQLQRQYRRQEALVLGDKIALRVLNPTLKIENKPLGLVSNQLPALADANKIIESPLLASESSSLKAQKAPPIEPDLKALEDPRIYPPIPPLPDVVQKVERIKSSLEIVPVESIPTIDELPFKENWVEAKENWIKVKETWLRDNSSLWQSKKIIWVERIPAIIGNERFYLISNKWMTPSLAVAQREGIRAANEARYQEAAYLLSYVPHDDTALMMLGKSFYQLGAYRDAFSVFGTAYKMGIPESKLWMDMASSKILENEGITQK